MYFENQKKMKQHWEMINNLKRGDKIVTSGGLIAKIIKVNDNKQLTIEISDNIVGELAPGMVSELVTKNDKNIPSKDNNIESKPSFFGLLKNKNKK